MLNIRTGSVPWLVKPCSTPGGTRTNVPGPATAARVRGPGEELDVAEVMALARWDNDRARAHWGTVIGP